METNLNESFDGRRRRAEGRVAGGLFQHLERLQVLQVLLVRSLGLGQLFDEGQLDGVVQPVPVAKTLSVRKAGLLFFPERLDWLLHDSRGRHHRTGTGSFFLAEDARRRVGR